MQIQVVTVGKIKEKYLTMGIDEYTKRLGPFARLEIHEVKDEKTPDGASRAEEAAILDKETARLEALIKPGTYLIALAINGRAHSSEEFAAHLDILATTGRSHLTFVIGGSLGLSPRLTARADLCLSFSPMTFPHQLFRLLLLEQIYRAFKINRGEPYHK